MYRCEQFMRQSVVKAASQVLVEHLVSTPLVLNVLWWTVLVWVVLVVLTVVLVVHLLCVALGLVLGLLTVIPAPASICLIRLLFW